MGLNELYNSIVDDVVDNVKEAFSEEGVDEQILKSLKESWLRRIREAQQPRQTPPQIQQQHQQNNINNNINNNSSTNSTNNSNNNNLSQSQQPQHASVIVYNNHQQQQPAIRSNDNLHASTALNLSQQHRQQLVAEVAGSHQRPHQETTSHVPQLDGSNGTSDEDENDDESDGDFPEGDDDVDVSDEEDKETDTNRDDEDPLNSGDDVSNDESSEMFDIDNVVVCQYDKITRNRNKWKFHLKDGIMNINGKDYVFQKAVGDAEW